MTQQASLNSEVEEAENLTQQDNDSDNENYSSENTEQVNDNNQSEQEEPDGFDPKERIEISDPKVKAKFNHLYKQVKMSDKRNTMYWDLIQKQQEKLEELESRFKQTDLADAEKILRTKLKEARDIGDDEAADKIMEDIVDFRLEKKLQSLTPKKDSLNKNQHQFETPEQQEIASFAFQTDTNGEPLHPWIDSNHPQHQRALKLTANYRDQVEQEFGYVDITEVMQRVSTAMKKPAQPQLKVKTNNRAPDPFANRGLTNNSNKGKLSLSPAEKDICRKLGLSEEEYTKWK